MRIGITSTFDHHFFCNGLNQNIITLYELLEYIGFEPTVIDFACTKKNKKTITHPLINKKHITSWRQFAKSPQHLDLLVCPGVAADGNIVKAVKSANKKAKIVSIHYGNNLINTICDWFSGSTVKGAPPTKDRSTKIYDESWISEHYLFAKEYYKFSDECEVKVLPYLWSPQFINRLSPPKYTPVHRPNLAVLEPNFNVTKNFMIPLLAICDLLETSPEAFDKAYIFGSRRIVDDKHKPAIMRTLKRCTAVGSFPDRVCFELRTPTPSVFRNLNPFIISHQHLNALNYTYLEALYYGFPLIHNSPFFKDVGYYYEDFAMLQASKMIKLAIETHNDNLGTYLDDGKEKIWEYSPRNPINQENTKTLILDLLK